jgi:hypothetical protein
VAYCALGHARIAYECPACTEAHSGNVAPIENWKWYRNRTSSKRIRALVDDYIKEQANADTHA